MGCEHTNVAAVCYFYSLRSQLHRWCSNKLWPIDGGKVSYYFQSACPYVDLICFCTVAKFCSLPPSGFPVLEHITGNISCQNPVLILLEGRFVFFVHDRICGKVWLFGSGVPSAGSIPNQTLGTECSVSFCLCGVLLAVLRGPSVFSVQELCGAAHLLRSNLLAASAPLTETRTCPHSTLLHPEARSLRGEGAVELRWGTERPSRQETAPHGPGSQRSHPRFLLVWLCTGGLNPLLLLKPGRARRVCACFSWICALGI